MLPFLFEAGYPIYDDKYSPNTAVVSFPVKEKYFERSKFDVTIWEQAQNAADYQRYWSDNNVSITITFKKEEEKDIEHLLECFEDKLKSVSFLPLNQKFYEQAPYEEITEVMYNQLIANIRPLINLKSNDKTMGVRFCDTEKCEL